METSTVAGRIRAYRKLKGYTQDELARLMGISIAVLGALERGTRKPDAKLIGHIAEVLKIDSEELWIRTGDR